MVTRVRRRPTLLSTIDLCARSGRHRINAGLAPPTASVPIPSRMVRRRSRSAHSSPMAAFHRHFPSRYHSPVPVGSPASNWPVHRPMGWSRWSSWQQGSRELLFPAWCFLRHQPPRHRPTATWTRSRTTIPPYEAQSRPWCRSLRRRPRRCTRSYRRLRRPAYRPGEEYVPS